MATRTPPKSDKWNRPTYERKDFSLATLPEGVAWAKGCELCEYGRPYGDPQGFCTCRAGQARRNWASGNMAPIEDEIHVPTFNAAYGGGE